MPWPIVKLGNAAKRIGGGTPSRKEPSYWGGNIPWFTVADLEDVNNIQKLSVSRECISRDGLAHSAAKLVPAGAIVFSSRVVVGKVGIAQNELVTNQDFSSFVSSDEFDTEFLAYFLIKAKSDLREHQRGATIKGVTTKVLESLDVPRPSKDEQRRIVTRIKECMERVEEIGGLRESVSVEAEDMCFAVVRDCFSLLSIKLGLKKLTDYADVNPRRPKEISDQFSGKNCTFVPMNSVNAVTGSIANPISRPFEEIKKGFTYFSENDVIFSKITPCMQNGKCAVARGLVNGVGFGSTEFHVIRAGEDILPDWIWLYLRLPEVRLDARHNFRGSAGQQRVPKEWFESLKLPVPNLERQVQLCSELIELTGITHQLRQEAYDAIQASSYLRESILRKAFAGEL